MSLRSIVAIERDGFDIRAFAMEFDVFDESTDLQSAVRKACSEYMKTSDGAESYYTVKGECFNWADFWDDVPNSICEKYGFRKINNIVSDDDVDWDEQLFDGYEDSGFEQAVDILEEFFDLLRRNDVNADSYLPWRENLFTKICDAFRCMEKEAETEKIYTRDWAARILEFLEDMLSDSGIILPSPEDDDKDEDNEASLYGSTYSDLLDSVESILTNWADDVCPDNYISDEFSGNC